MAPGGQSRIGPSARPIHRKLIIDGKHVLGDLAPSNIPGLSPDHERLIDSRKVDHCRGPYKGAYLSIIMRHERVLLSAESGVGQSCQPRRARVQITPIWAASPTSTEALPRMQNGGSGNPMLLACRPRSVTVSGLVLMTDPVPAGVLDEVLRRHEDDGHRWSCGRRRSRSAARTTSPRRGAPRHREPGPPGRVGGAALTLAGEEYCR